MSFLTKIGLKRGSGITAAATIVLGWVALIYGLLDNVSFDLPLVTRHKLHPVSTPSEVVILYMDDESHQVLHEKSIEAWNRTTHARLLERLKELGAKVVVFDILFETSTNNPAADLQLAQAMKAHGQVIIGVSFAPVLSRGEVIYTRTELPADIFQQAAGLGVHETSPREQYHLDVQATNLLSMAWRAAQITHPQNLPDPYQRRWMNYYGPPGAIPWLSYHKALNSDVSAEISNKVVFVGSKIAVGYTGGRGTDDYETPFTPFAGGFRSPGVELNAMAYLNLARREWLWHFSPWTEFLIVLGAGLVLGVGMFWLRPLWALGAGILGMILVFVVACLLMDHFHLWFPWAVLSFVQIPCAIIGAVVFNTQALYEEQKRLETALASRTPIPHSGTSARGSATLVLPTPSSVAAQMRDFIHTPNDDTSTIIQTMQGPPIPDHVLVKRVGAGAYGEVWLGKSVIGAYRAIKVVYRRSFRNDRPYEREFEGIKRFDPVSRQHPGLVHLLHVGRNDEGGYFYYLMELADDANPGAQFNPDTYEPKTLSQELAQRKRLSVDECISLGLFLSDSLAFLHQHGLIHRDIKPSNIIFVADRPKLADIGLVTEIGEGQTFVGTLGYSPPEGPGNPAGDLYSLGKVLYQTMTGLGSDKFPELPTALDLPEPDERFRRLNKIVLKACAMEVQRRYQSAQELNEDLFRLQRGSSRFVNFWKSLSPFGRTEHPAEEGKRFPDSP